MVCLTLGYSQLVRLIAKFDYFIIFNVQMKDRVQKFEKFIKENEGKRRRAIQKYQTEVKMKEQKNIELVLVIEQLELLKAR